MLTMALAAMDSTIVATAIPSIVKDLGGFSLFPWVFSVYLLVQAVTVPIYGKLADLYGRKPMLLIGTGIFLAGSALSGISWNMVALIAFRGLQGIGAGAIMPITSTVAGDLYTVKERGRIQGYLSSVWGVSAVIGPAIGGFFAQYLTWRWIFYINIPIGLLAAFVISRYLRERIERREHRIDVRGSVLMVAGVGLLIFGMLQGGVAWRWFSWQSGAIFAAAVVGLGAFWAGERRHPEPILPTWIVSEPALLRPNIATLAAGAVTIGLSSFLPLFSEGVMGTGAVVAGFVLAVMSIGWPIASSQSARLYMRIGFRNTGLIGSGLAVLSGVMFVSLSESAHPWQAAIASFVMGAGLGLTVTPLLVGIQSIVDWGRRGVVTGANMFGRAIGQTVGVALYGAIVNSTLTGWLAGAPPQIARHLPGSLSVTAAAIGGTATSGGHLPPAVEAYIRQGLYNGVHLVFWGITILAVLTLVVVLTIPSPLRLRQDAPG